MKKLKIINIEDLSQKDLKRLELYKSEVSGLLKCDPNYVIISGNKIPFIEVDNTIIYSNYLIRDQLIVNLLNKFFTDRDSEYEQIVLTEEVKEFLNRSISIIFKNNKDYTYTLYKKLLKWK